MRFNHDLNQMVIWICPSLAWDLNRNLNTFGDSI